MSSPLAMGLARPASPAQPAGAPPLPRRAAARRAVPPPPSPVGEARIVGKEEGVLSAVVTAAESTPGAQERKSDEGEVLAETRIKIKTSDGDGETEVEAEVPIAGSMIMAEAVPESAKESIVGSGDVEVPVSSTSASGAIVSDSVANLLPPASEGDVCTRTSMDTTRTKRSSSTGGEGGGFAGDATWEERTWKELMRLKEDMFWARIGGIRALRG